MPLPTPFTSLLRFTLSMCRCSRLALLLPQSLLLAETFQISAHLALSNTLELFCVGSRHTCVSPTPSIISSLFDQHIPRSCSTCDPSAISGCWISLQGLSNWSWSTGSWSASNSSRVDDFDFEVISLANFGKSGWDTGQAATQMLSKPLSIHLV